MTHARSDEGSRFWFVALSRRFHIAFLRGSALLLLVNSKLKMAGSVLGVPIDFAFVARRTCKA